MFITFLRAIPIAVALILAAPLGSNAAPSLPYMRALSMEGNWGGNAIDITNITDAYIQRLKNDHINFIGIKASIFNLSISDPTVQVRYRPASDTNHAHMYSFNDNDLINAITKFKQNGIDVYLSLVFMQPTIDQSSTCNTAQYGVDSHLFGDPVIPNASNSSAWGYQCIVPSLWWWNPSNPNYAANVATFWATYTQVAVKYATMAQQLGVGMFGIGEESDRLFVTRSSSRFPNNFKNQLTQMVSAIRAVYSGRVTYSQQVFVYLAHPEWWGLDFTASSSLFQDLGLDVVGLSAYFSLAPSPVTSVLPIAQLETAWNSVFQNYLVPIQALNPNTPIVFIDTGTTDSVNAPYLSLDQTNAPYVFSDMNNNGIDDGMEQQANIYQALFNVNKANNYLLRGTNFFGYMIDTNPLTFAANNSTRNMELDGRPAERVISNIYGDSTYGAVAGTTATTITPATPLPPPPTTQAVFTVPSGQMPTAAVSVSPSGTFGNATLTVTLDLSKVLSGGSFAGLGQFASGYNIYVAALAPSGALGLPSATWFVLPATHNWTLLSSPIAAYMEGLAQNATDNVVISILSGLDVTGLVGTEVYIGYGTSDTEMLTAGRYRGIYKVQ